MRRGLPILLAFLTTVVLATSLVQTPIQDLVAGAERIALVRVVETRTVLVALPGGGAMPAWETDLDVLDAHKGAWRDGESATWRHRAPSKTIGDPGTVWLQPGETYLLFLGTDSAATGLAAPIGETQGVFQQVLDEHDVAHLINGNGNLGLFSGLSKEKIIWRGGSTVEDPPLTERLQVLIATRQGPVERDALLELIDVLNVLDVR